MQTQESLEETYATLMAGQADAPAQEAAPEAPAAEPVAEPAPAVPETPVVSEALQTPKVDVVASKEFEELARRERAVRESHQERKELRRKVEELEAQSTHRNEMEQLQRMAKENPVEFINKFGLSYDDITNTILNDNKPAPEMALRNEITELKSQLAEIKGSFEAKQKQEVRAQEEAQYNKIIDQIGDFVKDSGDDFELVRLQNAEPLVLDVIREHYSANQKVMPYRQACQLVENHLEQAVRTAMSASRFQKTAPAPEAAPPEAGLAQSSPRPKTLTNQNTASPMESSSPEGPELLSADDSIEQLASQFKFWG